MAYIPYVTEFSCKYQLIAPDGTVASFNDTTDANYSGQLTDVTGLDSPDVRESADVSTQVDGGWHGNFWYGRRPITISGMIVNPVDALDRATKADRISRVSNALRQDCILYWQPSAAGSVPMQTWVRRQQPLRITGGWNKTFQLLLVSQYAPLFGATLKSNNLIGNSGFETDTSFWGVTDGVLLNSGSAVTRVTTQFQTGAASAQVVTTATSPFEGIAFLPLSVVAGQTYTVSAQLRGNAGGETVQLAVGGTYGGVNFGSSTSNVTLNNTGWTQAVASYTALATGTVHLALRTQTATAVTFFVDTVQATPTTSIQTYSASGTSFTYENQGSYPSAPTIRVYGPSTNMVITNTTTGQVIRVASGYAVAAGHYVDIDTLGHTMILDSTTDNSGSLDFANSTWPALIKGNNTYTLAGGGTLVVTYRDNWI